MSELGSALREAREAKDMTLEDLQTITKIQKRYLQAIEEGNFSQLPGAFYIRAFVKSYSEAVDLNSAEIFDTYGSELPKVASDAEPMPPRSSRNEFKPKNTNFASWVPKAALIVLLIGVGFLIWIAAQKLTSEESSTTPDNGDEHNVIISDPGQNKKDNKKDKQTEQSSKDKKNDKESKKESKETKPVLKLINEEGNTSYFELRNAEQFVIDISAKPDQSTWVRIRKESDSGEILESGMLSGEATFHFELTELQQVHVRIGSVPNTILKVSGKTLDFPSDATVQEVVITNKKEN